MWRGKVFAEARYHRIFIGDRHTDYIPVTFGFAGRTAIEVSRPYLDSDNAS